MNILVAEFVVLEDNEGLLAKFFSAGLKQFGDRHDKKLSCVVCAEAEYKRQSPCLKTPATPTHGSSGRW
jgi:hypothetical protein